MVRVYFEVTTQWMADIAPQQVADSQEDTDDTGELRVGQATGDLADFLELNGVEIDGPEIRITQVEHA
jgi:hypothetical protein